MQPPPPFDGRQPEAQPLYFDPGQRRWQPHPRQHWSCPPYEQAQSFSAAYGGYDQPYRYPHDREFVYPMDPQHGQRRHYDEEQPYGVGRQGRWYPDEPNPMHNFSQCGDGSSWHGNEPSRSSPGPNRATEDLSRPHWVSFDDKGEDKSLYPSRQDTPPQRDSATSLPLRTEALKPLDSAMCVTSAEEENVTRLDYQGSFLAKVKKFMVRNSEAFDALMKGATHPGPVLTLHDLSAEDSFKYAEPDALEYHMQVSRVERRKRFFELISTGDIVRGHVIAKKHSGLMVQVTSFVKSHKMRELTELTIKGLVSFDNLTVRPDKKGEVLDEMQVEDVLQAVVVGVEDEEDETLSLSLRGDHLPIPMLDMYLGYMEGETPLRPRRSDVGEEDFLLHLKRDPGFINSHCVENLKSVLGISATLQPSLLGDIRLAQYPESDFSDALRKAQRWKWSMDTVATGVKHFKAGEHGKAMKYFDHALDIDSKNVEGLVARGALFANNGKYKRAIANFEAALTLKHTHKNARKYLVETHVAYGQELEEEGNMDGAMRCYREALADNPEEETARVRLDILTTAAEKQAAEQKELERKKMEEKATLKKLHKIIEKEKKKKTKKIRHKKRKKTGKTSKKQKRKERRHTHYSSEETTASTSSYYSDSSRTLSPESPKRRRKHRTSGDRSRSRSRSESPSDRRGRRKHRTSGDRSRSRSRSESPSDRRGRRKHRTSGARSRSRSRSESPSDRRGRRKHRTSGDRSRSRSRSESPSDRRGRRTRATPSPDRSPRKAWRKKRHYQSKSARPRTPSPEHYKSRRQRVKHSDRSRSSSAESRSSRSRSRSASSRRKKTAHGGSISPSRKHRKQHLDKTEPRARREISPPSSGDQRSKKHSH